MKAYLLRRLLIMIPTFVGISIITFAIIQMAPGSPLTARLFSEGGMKSDAASAQILEQTKKLYGLDQPLHLRYVSWMKRMLLLDFGTSFKDHRPVLDKIAEALPVTLQLNLLSIFIAYLLAIPIGIYSATRQYSAVDSALTFTLFVLYSIPSFWAATMLLMFFAGGSYLDWFPPNGMQTVGSEAWPWYQQVGDRLWHYALPLVCYTYASLAGISRYMRTRMLETIRQDYIRTARAKGLTERVVIVKHALRNALIPVVTVIGLQMGALLGGAVLTETVFSWPGIGSYVVDGIMKTDYPRVQGAVLLIGTIFVLVNLVVDILYSYLDPRIQHM